jgi:hypothetical protein
MITLQIADFRFQIETIRLRRGKPCADEAIVGCDFAELLVAGDQDLHHSDWPMGHGSRD